jgi:iron complex transport system substrate-binding protein
MKKREKSFGIAFSKERLVLVEIAVVLCSLLCVFTLPAIAAEQTKQKISTSDVTTASADVPVLEIYGNANEDDKIDMRDFTYTARMILWLEDETDFADANYDGEVNVLDMTQIGLIILNRESELTLIDHADRTVTVSRPVERLICTLSHHAEALRILGVSKDTLVGVPSNLDPDFFPEFDDVTEIGDEPWNADVELVLALGPDVVILPSCGGPYGYTADEETKLLESAGVTVLRFCFNQPKTFPEELEKYGYVFGKKEEAGEFIDWHNAILNSIEEELSGADRKQVYCEYDTYMISKSDDEIIAAAGGEDIFEDMEGEVSAEAVMNNDPEIIIRAVGDGETGYGLNPEDTGGLEEIRADIVERLGTVSTVEKGEVYIISSQLWPYLPSSGCRSFAGLCYLAKWFHPELFDELEPQAIHQEYLTRFQGLNIDLEEQGVFVYHKEEGS